MRISDYRVFVCLRGWWDGSFIFFNSAHTQRLDPALELIHMSLSLILRKGGPLQDFGGATLRLCVRLCISCQSLVDH